MDTSKMTTDELRAYWEEVAEAFGGGELKEPFTISFRHAVNLFNLNVKIGYAVRLGEAWSQRAAIFMQDRNSAVALIIDNTATDYDANDACLDAIGYGLSCILWSATLGKQAVAIPLRSDFILSGYALTHGGYDNTITVQPNA